MRIAGDFDLLSALARLLLPVPHSRSQNEVISPTVKTLRLQRISLLIFGLAGALMVLFLGWEAVHSIGFLSDDFLHLRNARSLGVFQPIDFHHFSPLLVSFYKMAGNQFLSSGSWHLIALLLHLLNALLVYWVTLHATEWDELSATACALLFAFAPGGTEAVFWLAAFAYLPLLTLQLLALGLFLKFALYQTKLSTHLLVTLAVLQCLSLLIWDWGVLLTPTLAVAAISYWPKGFNWRIFALRLLTLLPGCLVLLSFLGYHLFNLERVGYGLFPLGFARGTGLLLASGGLALGHLLPKAAIPVIALLVIGIAAWGLWKDQRVSWLVGVYFLLQLPWYLQGAPSSRYAYFAMFFLLATLVIVFRRVLPKNGFYVVLLIALLVQAIAFQSALARWVVASSIATDLGNQIEKVPVLTPAQRSLVLVNLPDSLGNKHSLWQPPIWRNGITTIRAGTLTVYTPVYLETHRVHDPKVLTRQQISKMSAQSDILEVRCEENTACSLIPFVRDK